MKLKKSLSLALALAMTVSLVACGPKTTPNDKSSTGGSGTTNSTGGDAASLSGDITFLTNRTDLDVDGTYETLIAQFNETYPDIHVEVQAITDYAGELATRMQTKEYGDVLLIPDAVPSTEFGKYFLPLGTAEGLSSKYTEDYLYSKWFDGQVYGLAYMCKVNGIAYNKAVFEEAGITEMPKTPDEFLAALQLIKDNTDAIPYYTNTNSGWTLDQWEDHAFGTITGNADYKNNELPYDANSFAEGGPHYILAEMLYDIVTEGLCEADPTTCDWEASKGMLNRGEIGCMVLGNWAVQQIEDAGDTPENVGYMPFPYTAADGVQYATAGTDYCYGININSKYPEASRAFIDFMVDESGLALSSGGISLLKNDPMPSSLAEFEGVISVVDKPATVENTGKYDDVQADSGVTLYDGGPRLSAVVDIARGASSNTFEDFMANLSQKWAAAATK